MTFSLLRHSGEPTEHPHRTLCHGAVPDALSLDSFRPQGATLLMSSSVHGPRVQADPAWGSLTLPGPSKVK